MRNVVQPTLLNQSESSNYRNIFKATSLFGGVQIYQIFIQVLRSKLIAVLIGPLGVGIIGLYTTALDVFKRITSLGLAQSAVRDISEANGSGDTEKVCKVAAVIRKLVWITGFMGMASVLLFSPLVSYITFGNYEYIISFSILSIILLLDQLCAGQMVLLQGTRRLKDLAKSSAIGATIGLLISVPIYFFLSIDGIVPALLVTSVTSLLFTTHFSKKHQIKNNIISLKDAIKDGRPMIKMGIALCLSSVLVALNAYAIRGFIRFIDGAEVVGLFSAGASITVTYVGLVFNAMSTDFYPRLASVSKDNIECKRIVNQQGEIATLILAPLILLCVIFMPVVIQVLYSDKFLPASNYVMYSVVGMMFKLPGWLSSIQFVAKGNARSFAKNETFAGLYNLFISVLGYKLGGLEGLGISSVIFNFIYAIHMYILAKIHFDFSFNWSFIKVYFLQWLLIIISIILSLFSSELFRYLVGILLSIIITSFSIRQLTKCMGISLLSFVKRVHK